MPHQPGGPASTKRAVWFVTGSTGFGRELATQLVQLESRVVVTACEPATLGTRGADHPNATVA